LTTLYNFLQHISDSFRVGLVQRPQQRLDWARHCAVSAPDPGDRDAEALLKELLARTLDLLALRLVLLYGVQRPALAAHACHWPIDAPGDMLVERLECQLVLQDTALVRAHWILCNRLARVAPVVVVLLLVEKVDLGAVWEQARDLARRTLCGDIACVFGIVASARRPQSRLPEQPAGAFGKLGAR